MAWKMKSNDSANRGSSVVFQKEWSQAPLHLYKERIHGLRDFAWGLVDVLRYLEVD